LSRKRFKVGFQFHVSAFYLFNVYYFVGYLHLQFFNLAIEVFKGRVGQSYLLKRLNLLLKIANSCFQGGHFFSITGYFYFGCFKPSYSMVVVLL
jgi:hypothetical protein